MEYYRSQGSTIVRASVFIILVTVFLLSKGLVDCRKVEDNNSVIKTIKVKLILYLRSFPYPNFILIIIYIGSFFEAENRPDSDQQVDGGEVINCVDIYKQPALNHPLLKNHTIQVSSYSPIIIRIIDRKVIYGLIIQVHKCMHAYI